MTGDDLARLRNDPANANKGTVRGRALLEDSLRKYGAGRSILADRNGVVLAGNKTLESAADIGLPVRIIQTDGTELVVVQRTDLDLDRDPRARELATADNRIAELDLDWDVAELLAMRDAGLDLAAVGFDADELAALMAGLDAPTEGLTDPDAVPGVPETPITKPGDLWTLGRHRLYCGNAASIAAQEALFQGASPDIILTDPPYSSGGFQEAGKRQGSIGTRQNVTIQQDNLSTRGYLSLMTEALNGINADVLYMFTDWRMWPWTVDIAERVGFPVRNMLVWAKPTMGMGFPWRAQHELILFGKRTASKMLDGKRGNILQADRTGNVLHPTEKPVSLIGDVLDNTDGAMVYDPFAGSGTTLIGCEQAGRPCFAMELAPAYCDVIVTRWQDFTGQTAVRA